MIKLLKNLGLGLTLATLSDCGGAGAPVTAAASPAAQARALEDSVMAQHDRLMADLPRLYALQAQLKQAAAPAPVVGRLEAAEKAMKSWMYQYQAPDSTAPASQRLTYLQGQQQQLGRVEREMRVALDSAQAALRRAGR